MKKTILSATLLLTLTVNSQFSDPVNIYHEEGNTSDMYSSCHSIDLNNDGYIDLLTEQYGRIKWYENNKNNAFKAPVFIEKCSSFRNIKNLIGDANGDNIPDVLISDTKDLFWLLNDGSGAFNEKKYLIQDNPYYITNYNVVDLDGDGGSDVIFTNPSTVELIKDLGAGTFSASVEKPEWISLKDAYIITTADLNGDNKQDIFGIHESNTIINAYLNNGDETFNVVSTNFTWEDYYEDYCIDAYAAQHQSVVELIDLDNDGDLDFKSGVYNYINNGQATFSREFLPAIGSVYGDFDGDSNLDLIHYNCDIREGDYGNIGHYNILYSHFDESTNTLEESIIISPNHEDSILCFETLDIDNDGDLDLIYALYDNYSTNSNIGIYLIENIQGEATSTYVLSQSGVETYPSPATQILNIRGLVDGKVTLVNGLGSFSKEINISHSSVNSIDVSGFSRGLYYLIVQNENGEQMKTEKIILK